MLCWYLTTYFIYKYILNDTEKLLRDDSELFLHAFNKIIMKSNVFLKLKTFI